MNEDVPENPPPDDTKQTKRRLTAVEREVLAERMNTLGINQMIKRMRLWYAALAFLIVVAGVGFYLRAYMDQFATKVKVDAIEEHINATAKKTDLILNSMDAMREEMRRFNDRQERMIDRLLPRDPQIATPLRPLP